MPQPNVTRSARARWGGVFASSAAVLQVAMRRLRAEPVGVLMTLRDDPQSNMPFELERSFPESGVLCTYLLPG